MVIRIQNNIKASKRLHCVDEQSFPGRRLLLLWLSVSGRVSLTITDETRSVHKQEHTHMHTLTHQNCKKTPFQMKTWPPQTNYSSSHCFIFGSSLLNPFAPDIKVTAHSSWRKSQNIAIFCHMPIRGKTEGQIQYFCGLSANMQCLQVFFLS